MCFFMDSFESRMNPRFLAESEKGMLWDARVIESGRGLVEGFKEDEKGKRRASVLSSFSLSWFSVIHVFMLSVHVLSSLVRLVTYEKCFAKMFLWCIHVSTHRYLGLKELKKQTNKTFFPEIPLWSLYDLYNDIINTYTYINIDSLLVNWQV